MAPPYVRRSDGEIAETRRLRRAVLWADALRPVVQPAGELGARVDPELRVRVGEMRLNRAHGHEHLRCDFLVRQAARDQFGDALFAGGERAAGGGAAPADPLQLRAGRVSPAGAAELLERRSRLLERPARRGALLGAALRAPEVQERASALEPQTQLAVVGGGPRELCGRGIVVAFRQPDRSRGALHGRKPPRMLLLGREAVESLDDL